MNIKNRFTRNILICCFTIININLFCVGNNAYSFSAQNLTAHSCKKESSNLQQVRTTAYQSNWYHGTGVDVDITECKTQSVEFAQYFKDLYLCDPESFLPAEKTYREFHQTTIFDENHATGSWGYDNNGYEVNSRIQNWNYAYQKYTYIRKDTNNLKKWGIDPINVYLKNQELWPQKTDFREIKGDVVFEKDDNKSYIYNNAHDISFNVGVNRNFHNPHFAIYGIPHTLMKENQIIWVVYNWVSRYLWSLSGNYSANSHYTALDMVGPKPTATFFDPKEALSFVACDYSRKSVTVGWNDSLSGLQKEILEKAKPYLRFSLSFAVSDELHPGSTNNYTVDLDSSSLAKGCEIFLNPDENDKYHIQIKDIALKELSTSTTYVQSTNFTDMTVGSANLVKKYDTYTLEAPKITKIEFYNEHAGDYQKYPSQVSNENLFENHVGIFDSYGKRVPFAGLPTSMFTIGRDEYEGTISIIIATDDEHHETTIDNFRKASRTINDVRATPEYAEMVADELSIASIHDIVVANGYDPFVVDSFNLGIVKTDDENGCVSVSAAPKENSALSEQKFNITGLSKYYIKSIPINDKIIHKKPSTVTKDEIFSFFEMSKSFAKKNLGKIDIKIKTNDKTGDLFVQLSYVDGSNEFFFKFQPRFDYNFVLIICGSILMTVGACFSWRYYRSPKTP